MVDLLDVVKTGKIKLSQEEERDARMLYQNATRMQPYDVRRKEWRKDWLAFKFALVREKERQANGGAANVPLDVWLLSQSLLHRKNYRRSRKREEV